jgi:hypothetical protein
MNTGLLWVYLQTDTPFVFAMWASGILWLNCIPITHYIFNGYKREIFPFMPILGFFVSLSYSLPVFFIKPSSYEVAPLSEIALAYAFLGYFTFYCIYFSLRGFFTFNKGFNIISIHISDSRIRLLALFFLAINLFTIRIFKVPSFSYIGATGIYIYLGTYLYLTAMKVKFSFVEKLIYYFVLTEEFLLCFISGQFANLALLILYICIILFNLGKRFGKIFFLSFIFLLFYYFFAPIKYKYRIMIWFSNKEYTKFEKLNLVMELMMDPSNYDRNKIPEKYRDRMNLLWRPSYEASALSLVTSKTPYEVPFWNGETYILLPKLIPRIIWANKPTEDASLKYAIRYGLIYPTQKTSPYPLPILAEMYMNFGETGIVLGMMMLAILYNILNGYFNNSKISGVGKIYSIAIIFSFIYHEGNLTMTFGNIPLQAFSIYFICRLFQSPYFVRT